MFASMHSWSYAWAGRFAAASEGGLHPKHRLIRYHQFFVERLAEGERVLEVGCGNGALLEDVANKTKGFTVGVEIDGGNAAAARKRLGRLANVEIVHGDVWAFDHPGKFTVIVLSNTLEHLQKRPELLRHLKERFCPEKFLIRVPMFEREWLVPYKKELGMEWRLDPTHEIEFTQEEIRAELSEAGLVIASMDIRWGEFYVVAS